MSLRSILKFINARSWTIKRRSVVNPLVAMPQDLVFNNQGVLTGGGTEARLGFVSTVSGLDGSEVRVAPLNAMWEQLCRLVHASLQDDCVLSIFSKDGDLVLCPPSMSAHCYSDNSTDLVQPGSHLAPSLQSSLAETSGKPKKLCSPA